MYSLMVLLLVTVAQAFRPNCEKYCRIPIPERLESLDRYCNCSTPNKNFDFFKHPIFYEPFENVIYAGQPYQYPSNSDNQSPHIIWNPKYNNDVSKNRITALAPSASNGLALDSELNHSKRNSKFNIDSSNHDVNIKTNHDPLYLDINIYESKNDDRSRVYGDHLQLDTTIDDIEENVKDCIHLHVLIESRINASNIHSRYINQKNKTTYYNGLSDLELMIELNKKCNQIDAVINKGVNYTKNTRPFQIQKYQNTEYTQVHDKPQEENNLQNTINLQNLKESYYNELSSSETQPVSKTTEVNENSSITTIIKYTTPLMDTLPPEIDSTTESFHDRLLNSTLDFESTSTNVNILNILNQTQEYNEETTPSEYFDSAVSSTMSSQSTDFYTNVEIPTTSETEIEETETFGDGITEIAPSVSNIVTTFDDNSHEVTNIEIEETQNIDDSLDDNAFLSSSRPQYLEGEYDVPKIVTTELSDDTITSEMQGKEKIPNSDFIKHSGRSEVDQNGSWSLNDNGSLENVQRVENKAEPDIVGKLYFKYGKEYLPAEFVQKSNGNLNVAMDLTSLCESNKINKTKSLLVGAICKCIEIRNL